MNILGSGEYLKINVKEFLIFKQFLSTAAIVTTAIKVQ